MSVTHSVLAGLLAAVVGMPIANATLATFSDRATFESQGTISERYGFEDFGPYPDYPGDPWQTHGVTYSSQQNLVFFGSLGSKPPAVSHVLISSYWLYISGELDSTPSYRMLGLDLAVLFATATAGNVTLTVITNQDSYTFDNLELPDISVGQKFFGFASTGAEQITGFDLTSDTWGTGAALDNVTLGGVITTAPEPNGALLFLAGLAFLLWRASARHGPLINSVAQRWHAPL